MELDGWFTSPVFSNYIDADGILRKHIWEIAIRSWKHLQHPNESLSRCFINLPIFNCVLEERILIKSSKGRVQPQKSFIVHRSRFQSHPRRQIQKTPRLHHEKKFVFTLQRKLGRLSVSKANTMNFIVVEAMRRFEQHLAYGRLLAYNTWVCESCWFNRYKANKRTGRHDSQGTENRRKGQLDYLWARHGRVWLSLLAYWQ